MFEVNCPECDGIVEVPKDSVVGEIIQCPHCGVELEIVEINENGVKLELAPEVDEDWGE